MGASIAGCLNDSWFERAREAQEASNPTLGITRTLLKGWVTAVPLAAITKACAVAAVIIPVGGWLAFDAGTAVADLGGMLAAVTLWRTVLLTLV